MSVTTMGTSIRILLVAAVPYVRMRIWHLLAREPGAHLLDRVSDTVRGVAQIQTLRPDLVLCDIAVASDPAFATLFMRRPGETVEVPPLVLLSADSLPSGARYQVPIAAVLPLDLPPWEMVTYLSTLVDAHDLPPGSLPATLPNRSRSAIVAPSYLTPAVLEGGSDSRRTPAAPRQESHRQAAPRWSPTTYGGVDRRASREQPPVDATALQAAPGQQLDPVTGLADRSVLEHAAVVLAELSYPATLIVLDLEYVPGSVVPADITARNAVLHWTASSLRVAVRRDDLLSRVGDMTFALLLPGLDHRLGEVIARRLLDVIDGIDLSRYAYGAHLQAAISVSYWDQGLPAPALLSMVARTRETAAPSATVQVPAAPVAEPLQIPAPRYRIDLSGGIPQGEQPASSTP